MAAINFSRRRQKEALWGALGLGPLIGLWVGMDPFLGWYGWGVHYFPYLLTIIVVCAAGAAILLFSRVHDFWRHNDLWAIAFAIIAAQFSGVTYGNIDLLELATFILLGLQIIQLFVETDRKIQVSSLSVFILGLMLLSFLAMVNRPPITGIITMGEKFVLFFLLVNLIRRESLLKPAAHVVVWAGIFSAVIAISQAIVFFGWGRLWAIVVPAEDPTSILKPTPFGLMPRATAFFPNPAGLGDYLLLSTSIALFGRANAKTSRLKWFYSIAVLLMSIAIMLAWSLTVLLGLSAIFFFFLYFHRPSLAIHYTAAVALVLLVLYETSLMEEGYKFLKGYGEGSGEVRLFLLQLAFSSLQRNPWIGLGVKNFASFSGNFFIEGPYIMHYPVHNAFFQMATELGIVGGAIFTGIVAFIFFRIFACLSLGARETRWIFKGLLLGWLGIFPHLLTEPMAYGGTLWLILGLTEGMGMVTLAGASARTAAGLRR